MLDKLIRKFGPDHPITVKPHDGHVVVTVGDQTIADTRAALTLQEASYDPVLYIPRADADMNALERTNHTTHCPYKGDASYYSIPAGGERSRNAVWTYETPNEGVEAIKDHLAFYRDRVDSIDERAG